jgi:hypothetical protein
LQAGDPAEAKAPLLVATRAMPDSVEYRQALAEALSALERSQAGDPPP